jgi:flagellar basal-body rod protein FlgF
MDALTVSAVSGMKARLESLSLLANNIANSSSPGFKADSEVYSLYTSEIADTGAAPLIERRWTDFSQGTPLATGNTTDLALRGDGFFQVAGPGGEPLLTRNGSFLIAPGGRLETQDGNAVLDSSAAPITGLDPRAPLEIGAAGEIRQNGREIARLGVVSPAETASLQKRGALYFSASEPGSTLSPSQAEVLQGRLETANVAAPVAAVRLIDVLRQFETLQKAIQINSEMGQRLDEIARVGN